MTGYLIDKTIVMTIPTNDKFTPAYRAILTAVFVGIADALISLIFNIAYRSGGADFPQDLVNVSYLIFGTVFLFFVVGLLFMGLHLLSQKGSLIFIVLFATLTLIAFVAVGSAHLADSEIENHRYHGMLRGLILIDGITAAALIPYFYSSPKFAEHVV
jgi:hypothetical protein